MASAHVNLELRVTSVINVLQIIGILENLDMNMNIHEYVTHRTFEHDFNILLQGGESGQLPLLDSTFEGNPQN